MPRSIQTSNQAGEEVKYRTIAHELGHGVFHLNHTFDTKHDPGIVLRVFERDEDGAMMNGGTFFTDNILEEIDQIRQGNKPQACLCLLDEKEGQRRRWLKCPRNPQIFCRLSTEL